MHIRGVPLWLFLSGGFPKDSNPSEHPWCRQLRLMPQKLSNVEEKCEICLGYFYVY